MTDFVFEYLNTVHSYLHLGNDFILNLHKCSAVFIYEKNALLKNIPHGTRDSYLMTLSVLLINLRLQLTIIYYANEIIIEKFNVARKSSVDYYH